MATIPTGNYSLDQTTSSSAMGGRVDNGPIFNSSSSGGLGLVKTLAYAGIAFVFLRMYKKKK